MKVALPRAALALAALTVCAAAHADIYGYVDANGVAHFSNMRLDGNYRLYKRDPVSRPQMSYGAGGESGLSAAVEREKLHGRRYGSLISTVAREERVDPALLHAVVKVESGYNARALSPKGAAGLMQLMPDTARRYSVSDIWDPRQNLRGGARYLRDLLAMFNDDLSLALAAYNAGEKAVVRAGLRIPPFAETRDYVPRVLEYYRRYRAGT
jgi:soluble lytic murein transglycosylase-like protein